MISNKMSNIQVDSFQLQTKRRKEIKYEECKSLFLKKFIEEDPQLKITEMIKEDIPSKIHMIKLRTLSCTILNLEKIVYEIREMQRFLLYFMNLVDVN